MGKPFGLQYLLFQRGEEPVKQLQHLAVFRQRKLIRYQYFQQGVLLQLQVCLLGFGFQFFG